jgi:RNA polymerase sigma-70 factor (ECF subfamily)
MNTGASAPGSFDELFEAYGGFVWRVLGRLGVARSDLEDASQEVFLVVHRRLDSFEGRSSLKTWIYGICLKVAASSRRKSRRHEVLHGEEPGGHAQQEQELEHQRAKRLLFRTLEALSAEKREVFVLYEMEELSMPEVAELVGCPVTTAYSRLEAARKTIRASFARSALTGWQTE